MSPTPAESLTSDSGATAKPTLAARDPEEPAAVMSLPSAARRPSKQPAAKAVPDVRGMSVRQAVHALHAAGFRVKLSGLGTVTSSYPDGGQLAREGELVRLVGGR